jgi:hypothetical protein
VTNIRPAFAIVLGAAAVVALQVLVAKLVPPLGSGYFLATIAALSVFEDHGFATLQSSSDGWPVPTELGAYVAAAIWWALWCAVLAGWRWLRLPSQPSPGKLVGFVLPFLSYFLLASIALAAVLPLYVLFNVLSLFFTR